MGQRADPSRFSQSTQVFCTSVAYALRRVLIQGGLHANSQLSGCHWMASDSSLSAVRSPCCRTSRHLPAPETSANAGFCRRRSTAACRMRFSSCHCVSHLAHAVARRLCCNRSKTRAALTSRLFFSTYPIHVSGLDVWSATMVCLAGAERALANCSWSHNPHA